ncbi:uncharacterized protein LOC135480754 [Liolophura sinensis]|uniref:uncharacterized protein LOC135480754 n=1 Tax=Liolophura sinensis TaxID=3198878 RepID=UPI0031592777
MPSYRFSLTVALLASSLTLVACGRSCEDRGCPTGSECLEKKTFKTARFPRCLRDLREVLQGRLDEFVIAWNSRDYEGMEDFFTEDSVFVPAGRDIRRGSDGYAEFIEGLITEFQWGNATYVLEDIIYVTDELVFSIDTFVWESGTSPSPLHGKELVLWKKIDGIYYIHYGISNLG